jgi:DNA-binding NtrC family response regulator
VENLGIGAVPLDEEHLRALSEHSWPGNVRELKHCIERMAALGAGSPTDLRRLLTPGGQREATMPASAPARPSAEPAQPGAEQPMSIADGELHLISVALAATSGNRAKAAEILRISRTTLYRRLRQYGGRRSATPVRGDSMRHRTNGSLLVAHGNSLLKKD